MRVNITCPKCEKVLAKMDDDGAVHIKRGKRLPEIIASGRVLIVCPSEVLRPGEAPTYCNLMTEISGKDIFFHVSGYETNRIP